MLDRSIFFDKVRHDPFPDALGQGQVDGMSALLDYWENNWWTEKDLRWLAYILATTQWETASTMQPIEEYGKGAGQPYGVEDPQTLQTYFGRGYVQLTWRDNYANATKQLGLVDDEDLEWNAEQALNPSIAAAVIFEGMKAGWFTGRSLPEYFNDERDDPVDAREIVNGHDHDQDIAELHHSYLLALQAAWKPGAAPVQIAMIVPDGVAVRVTVNGVPLVPHH